MLRNSKILILTLLILSCNEKSKDTQILENYLKTTFNKNIEKRKVSYVLISGNSCEGCYATAINIALVNTDSNIIYIFPKQFSKYFSNNIYSNVLIDTLNKINKIKFHKGNVCKIYTSNHNIDSIANYEFDNISSLEQ